MFSITQMQVIPHCLFLLAYPTQESMICWYLHDISSKDVKSCVVSRKQETSVVKARSTRKKY